MGILAGSGIDALNYRQTICSGFSFLNPSLKCVDSCLQGAEHHIRRASFPRSIHDEFTGQLSPRGFVSGWEIVNITKLIISNSWVWSLCVVSSGASHAWDNVVRQVG